MDELKQVNAILVTIVFFGSAYIISCASNSIQSMLMKAIETKRKQINRDHV